jgi:hypothetical protein
VPERTRKCMYFERSFWWRLSKPYRLSLLNFYIYRASVLGVEFNGSPKLCLALLANVICPRLHREDRYGWILKMLKFKNSCPHVNTSIKLETQHNTLSRTSSFQANSFTTMKLNSNTTQSTSWMLPEPVGPTLTILTVAPGRSVPTVGGGACLLEPAG